MSQVQRQNPGLLQTRVTGLAEGNSVTVETAGACSGLKLLVQLLNKEEALCLRARSLLIKVLQHRWLVHFNA